MRKMNCRNVRCEIEEVATGELLSLSANDHLKTCSLCGTFRDDRLKLREMLSSLGSIEAPGDFEFRLRARLAKEDHKRSPFVMRNLSFGFRAATVATMLLLVGAALLFINLRPAPESSVTAIDAKPAVESAPKGGQQQSPNDSIAANDAPKTVPASVVDTQKNVALTPRRNPFKQAQVASLPKDTTAGMNTRDSGIAQARVLKAKNADAAGSSAFPIGTSFQSLKVSLDDGRGTARTISVPSVSFGSQRVLSSGSSPLLASARSDW